MTEGHVFSSGYPGGFNPRYKQFFGLILRIITVNSAQWGGGGGWGEGGLGHYIYVDDYRLQAVSRPAGPIGPI